MQTDGLEKQISELYVGQVDMNAELRDAQPVPMAPEGEAMEGVYRYAADTSIARSGLHGFTVQVRPYHPDMPMTFIPGLITWPEPLRSPHRLWCSGHGWERVS